MASKRIQVPVLGGLRKSVKLDTSAVPGTTISEFGSGTITLAQLKAALGVSTTVINGGSSGGSTPSSLVPGPGLAGGGALIGPVPLNLTAPIPAFIFGDDGGGGDSEPGPPGQRGADGSGATGAQGPLGPAVFMAAEDGIDGFDAIPGQKGFDGAAGPTGAAGPAGIPVFMISDDGMDGDMGAPGPQGIPGTGGGGGGTANIVPETHPAIPDAMDDEFEGTSLDAKWTWFNQGLKTVTFAQGSALLACAYEGGTFNLGGIEQAIPAGNWKFRTRIPSTVFGAVNFVIGGLQLRESSGGKILDIHKVYSSSYIVEVDRWNSFSSYNSTLFSNNIFATAGYPYSGGVWFEVEYDGTNYYFRYSFTGYEGTYVLAATEAVASFLGTPADRIGLTNTNSGNGVNPSLFVYDLFRRVA